MFSTDSKFDECFKHFVVKCEFADKSLFYNGFHICTKSQRAQTNLFLKIQPITQSTVIKCAT